MTPRHLAQPITCCLLLLFLGVDIVCAAASGRKPNVILVMTDDQGYGDLSCHGNPVLETPHLDALHRESIRLTDFHSAPMCTATRGQLLTGCDALHNGATHVSCGRLFVRRGIPTMADIFSATGYQTGHFGKWHLGGNYPYRPQDRGFQETVGFRAFGLTAAPNYWNSDYFDDHYLHNGKTEQYPGYCTDVWFNEAMEWIKEQHKTDKPFFAYLATNAPHLPFWVPDRYRKSYRDQDPDVASFFAMLANIDENMGRLRLMLQKTGLAENTILIYLTDNGTVGGQSVFNAGMRGNKAWLYEGGHRVPCFIHWPAGGLRDPGDVDALTECQDLLGMAFQTHHFCGQYWIPDYEDWLMDRDMTGAYRTHQRTLKLLQWRCPPNRWQLKPPVHMLSLDSLDRVYPDARFIMTHRDPATVLGSLCALIRVTRSMASEKDDPHRIGREQLAVWTLAMERAVAFRERVAEERFADVFFTEQLSDPVGVVERAYAKLDLPFADAVRARMAAWSESHQRGRQGSYRYRLEDFGLDAGGVRERFQAYLERFAIPLEEAP